MKDYPKALKRKLRELGGLAYERELHHELAKLEADFKAWREGTLDSFELSDRIHIFHNGASREHVMGGRFSDLHAARGINFGFIAEDEVPADVLDAIRPLLDKYRARNDLA